MTTDLIRRIGEYSAVDRAVCDNGEGQVTGLNMLVFTAAFLLQYAIGAVIELWPATGDGSYARDRYQAAFVFVVGLEIPALVWFLWPGKGAVRGAPS